MRRPSGAASPLSNGRSSESESVGTPPLERKQAERPAAGPEPGALNCHYDAVGPLGESKAPGSRVFRSGRRRCARAGNRGGKAEGPPMTMTDPIADMLTRLRNGNSAYHDSVTMPYSKLKARIAEILQQEGYIASYTAEELQV